MFCFVWFVLFFFGRYTNRSVHTAHECSSVKFQKLCNWECGVKDVYPEMQYIEMSKWDETFMDKRYQIIHKMKKKMTFDLFKTNNFCGQIVFMHFTERVSVYPSVISL